MAVHEVTAERLAGAQARFEIDAVARAQVAEVRAVYGFRNGIEDERITFIDDRKANAVDRDAVAALCL